MCNQQVANSQADFIELVPTRSCIYTCLGIGIWDKDKAETLLKMSSDNIY